jgi:PIN domain nuclease of toxin-antitoxin system
MLNKIEAYNLMVRMISWWEISRSSNLLRLIEKNNVNK